MQRVVSRHRAGFECGAADDHLQVGWNILLPIRLPRTRPQDRETSDSNERSLAAEDAFLQRKRRDAIRSEQNVEIASWQIEGEPVEPADGPKTRGVLARIDVHDPLCRTVGSSAPNDRRIRGEAKTSAPG